MNDIDDRKRKNTRIAFHLALTFGAFLLLDFIFISIVFTWSDWIATLLFSLLLIVPAYISNAGMVIVGGGKPIDAGKKCKDGRRIFGDHKTWKGLIRGPLFIGIPISIVIFMILYFLWPIIQIIPNEGINSNLYELYDDIWFYKYYFIGGPFPVGLLIIIFRIILTSYGAALGDLIGSFLKRRVNIPSGEPFWIVDQIDFALIAILFSFIPSIIFNFKYLSPDLNLIVFLLILTPSVNIIANSIAYVLKLKDVPW